MHWSGTAAARVSPAQRQAACCNADAASHGRRLAQHHGAHARRRRRIDQAPGSPVRHPVRGTHCSWCPRSAARSYWPSGLQMRRCACSSTPRQHLLQPVAVLEAGQLRIFAQALPQRHGAHHVGNTRGQPAPDRRSTMDAALLVAGECVAALRRGMPRVTSSFSDRIALLACEQSQPAPTRAPASTAMRSRSQPSSSLRAMQRLEADAAIAHRSSFRTGRRRTAAHDPAASPCRSGCHPPGWRVAALMASAPAACRAPWRATLPARAPGRESATMPAPARNSSSRPRNRHRADEDVEVRRSIMVDVARGCRCTGRAARPPARR